MLLVDGFNEVCNKITSIYLKVRCYSFLDYSEGKLNSLVLFLYNPEPLGT